jgi:hypothetical protein
MLPTGSLEAEELVYVIQVYWQLVSRSKCSCSQAVSKLVWHIPVPPLPGYRPATSWVHYTTTCNTQSSAPEHGRNHRPKHVELIGIINKPLLLHLVGCIYSLYKNANLSSLPNNLLTFLHWSTCSLLDTVSEENCIVMHWARDKFPYCMFCWPRISV